MLNFRWTQPITIFVFKSRRQPTSLILDAGNKLILQTYGIVFFSEQIRTYQNARTYQHPSNSQKNGPHNGYYVLKMLQQHTSLSLALTFITFDAHTNYSYWSSPQISNATGNVVADLDDSGSFSITYGESSSGTVYIHKNESVSNQDSILRRIRVETDGNLRLYEWNTSTAKWDIAWSAVSNPCEVAGICGNGICKLDSIGVSYNCSDLPDLNTEHCDKNMKMDTWAQTNYYFLGSSTIANYNNVTGALDFPKYCQMDCDCVASLYGVNEDATMYCWTLREMVFGGLQDPSWTFFMKNSDDG